MNHRLWPPGKGLTLLRWRCLCGEHMYRDSFPHCQAELTLLSLLFLPAFWKGKGLQEVLGLGWWSGSSANRCLASMRPWFKTSSCQKIKKKKKKKKRKKVPEGLGTCFTRVGISLSYSVSVSVSVSLSLFLWNRVLLCSPSWPPCRPRQSAECWEYIHVIRLASLEELSHPLTIFVWGRIWCGESAMGKAKLSG
jgi:hypothetical protein